MPLGTSSPNDRTRYVGNVASKCRKMVFKLIRSSVNAVNLQKVGDEKSSVVVSKRVLWMGWNDSVSVWVNEEERDSDRDDDPSRDDDDGEDGDDDDDDDDDDDADVLIIPADADGDDGSDDVVIGDSLVLKIDNSDQLSRVGVLAAAAAVVTDIIAPIDVSIVSVSRS